MYSAGDKVTMKKPHPCGGKEWQIVRLGVDVKLQCLTCARYVMLTRDELKKRAKAVETALVKDEN